ncbi:MAG: hypothetical protein IT534_14565 [Bauldia sp.]|nr:hypothetical protein [Bauldia sp.]
MRSGLLSFLKLPFRGGPARLGFDIPDNLTYMSGMSIGTGSEPRKDSGSEEAARRVVSRWLHRFDDARQQRDAAETTMKEAVELIGVAMALLPPAEQLDVQRRLDVARSASVPARATRLHANVIELFRQDNRREWAIPEISRALTDRDGAAPDPKALSNILNYLERSGRLKRVDRGRYLIRDYGAEIDFDDREDGVRRGTEHEV